MLLSAVLPKSSVETTVFMFEAKRCSLIARAAASISRASDTTNCDNLICVLNDLPGADRQIRGEHGHSGVECSEFHWPGGHVTQTKCAIGLGESLEPGAFDEDAGVFHVFAGAPIEHPALNGPGRDRLRVQRQREKQTAD
jgi:hypothetical protein